MKARPFFHGDHLRATLFRPRRRKLFVSFRQRIGDPGTFDDAIPVMGFTRRGFAHLHIQSRRNDWFINPETEMLEGRLAALSEGFEEVVAMGFSMGGYGAFRFARALRLTRVLAISPQVSIDPAVVPFDRRYRAEAQGWDGAQGDLSTRGMDVGGVVLADPFKPADLCHAEMLRSVFPRVHVVRLPFGGHPATRVLRQGGHLDWLRLQLIDGFGAPAEITRAHRASRRRSESYWRELALAAGRRGRNALAEHALSEAERLSRPARQNVADAHT